MESHVVRSFFGLFQVQQRIVRGPVRRTVIDERIFVQDPEPYRSRFEAVQRMFRLLFLKKIAFLT